MPRFKLTLAYDGTDFHGWQVQPEGRTVQGVLQETLTRIVKAPTKVYGAGRTDAGVHARGQVAHFDTGSRMTAEEFRRALNATLPPDVGALGVEEAADDFDSRRAALGKVYTYRLALGGPPRPLERRFIWRVRYRLAAAPVREALPHLLGRHDFAAFQAADTDTETSVRELFVARLDEISQGPDPVLGCAGVPGMPCMPDMFDMPAMAGTPGVSGMQTPGQGGQAPGAQWRFVFIGDGFLRHMVRIMVGTLVEVARGRVKPEELRGILAGGDRDAAGPTAPGRGLVLERVVYQDAEWKRLLAAAQP